MTVLDTSIVKNEGSYPSYKRPVLSFALWLLVLFVIMGEHAFAQPSVSLNGNGPSCVGLTDGKVVATVSGGTANYTYNWSNGTTNANTPSLQDSITGLSPGTYTVTITDNNGLTGASAIFISSPFSIIPNAVATDVSCNGESDGKVTATPFGGTGAYTYQWSNGATGNPATGLAVGTYTVTVTDANGCTAVDAGIVVDQPDVLQLNTAVEADASCGASDGSVSVTVNGGTNPYSYSWSNGTTQGNTTLAFQSFESLSSDTWNYTVDPTTYNTEGDSIVSGSEDVWAVVQQFTGDIDSASDGSLFWGTQDLNNSNGGRNTNHFLTFDPIDVSAYSSVVLSFDYYSDGFDSSDSLGYQVIYDNGASWPSPAPGSNAVALGKNNDEWQTVTIDVPDSIAYVRLRFFAKQDGSSDYSGWDNIRLESTTSLLTGLTAGTYTVTVTDANGCTASNSATVSGSSTLSAASVVDSNVGCNGDSDGGATASAAGGTAPYTYNWSNGATNASITGVSAGTYSVTITDQSGCTDSTSVSVTEPAALTAATVVDSNVSCNGFTDGGATAFATGGTGAYTYNWSNGATNASITGVSAGTYSVTVTDQNGCTDSASTIVTEPSTLTAATVVDSNTSCNGDSDGGATAFATGGTPSYTYNWSNGATTASITSVVAGTYSVTVTDANGCTDSASVTVTEPALLVAATVVDSNASCNGDSNGGATASATGGTMAYTYIWSNGATTASITNLTAGTYSVTITDANGCTDSASTTITEPTLLSASSVKTDVVCNGESDGSIDLTSFGGTAGYTYSWSNGATTEDLNGISIGTYTVTVTDANGCTATNSQTMSEPSKLIGGSVN